MCVVTNQVSRLLTAAAEWRLRVVAAVCGLVAVAAAVLCCGLLVQ